MLGRNPAAKHMRHLWSAIATAVCSISANSISSDNAMAGVKTTLQFSLLAAGFCWLPDSSPDACGIQQVSNLAVIASGGEAEEL
jgi:hypothetical protein